jgi:hypothetical protein
MAKPNRRKLNFTCLNDAVTDARRLQQSGYTASGNWNLAQVVGHCSQWLSFPMDGYPKSPLPIRAILWLARCTFGKSFRKKILQAGRMKAGAPTMPSTVRPANFATEAATIEELAKQVQRFEDFNGQLHESPLFGKMSKDEHRRLQLIHLQHHLSFLIPKSDG